MRVEWRDTRSTRLKSGGFASISRRRCRSFIASSWNLRRRERATRGCKSFTAKTSSAAEISVVAFVLPLHPNLSSPHLCKTAARNTVRSFFAVIINIDEIEAQWHWKLGYRIAHLVLQFPLGVTNYAVHPHLP